VSKADKTIISVYIKTKELMDTCWWYIRQREAAEREIRKDNSFRFSFSQLVNEALEEKLEREKKYIDN